MNKNRTRQRPTGGWFDDHWWIDLIERELKTDHVEDQATNLADIEIFLKNSAADRMRLESLFRIRGLIEKSDPVSLPEDGRYYEQLQARVMASLDRPVQRRHQSVERASPPVNAVGEKTSQLKTLWTFLLSTAI